MKKIIYLLLMLIIFVGCNKEEESIIEYKNIDCKESKKLIDSGAILIDVRSKEEYEKGYLKDAINISNIDIIDKIEKNFPDKESIIIVYCQSGGRSADAAEKLVKNGYKKVYNLGGINNCHYEDIWKEKK